MKTFLKATLATLCVGGVLVGCAPLKNPAQVVNLSSFASQVFSSVAGDDKAKPAASGARYTVTSGDTIYNISQRFGVDKTELMRLNGITDPTQLSIGQVLVLPGVSPSHQVSQSVTTYRAKPNVKVRQVTKEDVQIARAKAKPVVIEEVKPEQTVASISKDATPVKKSNPQR